jgi:hypothetical protein
MPEGRGGVRLRDICTPSGGDVVGTLCARDFKGVGNQYFWDNKVFAYPIEG